MASGGWRRRWRREGQAAAAVLVVMACAIGFAATRGKARRPIRLTMSAGQALGARHRVAERLAEEARAGRLRIEVRPTAGSAEALDRVEAGTLDLALVQGGLGGAAHPHVRQVATLQVEPLHLLVKAAISEPARRGLAALRGKVVNLGEVGSGTHLLAREVLRFAGLRPGRDPASGDYVASTLGYARLEAIPDLDAMPDAVFLVSTLPSRVARQLVARHGYRLVPLPFGEAFALDALIPEGGDPAREAQDGRVDRIHVEEAVIPPYTYGIDPGEPVEPVRTLGTRLLLVARESMDPEAVGSLLEATYGTRFVQVARPPLSSGLLDLPPELPWHRGTVAYLERNKPLIASDMIDLLEKEVSISGVVAGGAFFLWQGLRRWYRRRRERGLETYLLEVMEIERRAQLLESSAAPGLPELLGLQAELGELKAQALRRFAVGEVDGGELMTGFLMYVNDARDYLNRQILHERNLLEGQAQAEGRSPAEAWLDAVGGPDAIPAREGRAREVSPGAP